MKISCPKCGNKEVDLKIIVHSTQGDIYGIDLPSGKGNRLTFVLRCLTGDCTYSRMAYEERAYELEDRT